MESLDVVYCALERFKLFGCEDISRARKLLLGHGQAIESNAVEAFRIRTEGGVAVPANRVDYLECDGSNVGARLLFRPR
jgi:hypothetical protein